MRKIFASMTAVSMAAAVMLAGCGSNSSDKKTTTAASTKATEAATEKKTEAGAPGILLGIGCTVITGLAGYLVYKLLKMDYPEVGGAIGTTAGNAAATPASVAAVDATLLAVSEAATAQITAAIIVTAICCPLLVSTLHKMEEKRRAAKK